MCGRGVMGLRKMQKIGKIRSTTSCRPSSSLPHKRCRKRGENDFKLKLRYVVFIQTSSKYATDPASYSSPLKEACGILLHRCLASPVESGETTAANGLDRFCSPGG